MKLNKLSRCLSLSLCALAIPYASAQVPGSALDYMLQRPRVTKTYDHKSFGDRLFLEAGAGVNVVGSRNPKPGVLVGGALGDWVTPEHGWRLGLESGVWSATGIKTKYADLALDYLMNITAIAQRTYPEPPRFEVMGVAGINMAYSRYNGHEANGMGFHLGLRGQYAFSPYTYIYVEPRAGVVNDGVLQNYNWRGVRPVASVALGLGYRLAPWANLPAKRPDNVDHYTTFGDGIFLSLMGGPSFLANTHPTTWPDYVGGRVAVSVGKWFNASNGLRLSVNTTLLKQNTSSKARTLGGQVEYVANLHEMFGGYNPYRYWWVNGLVGGSFNVSSAHQGHHTTFGASAGLQGNVRLGRAMTLFLEPRVDAYQGDYAPNATTVSRLDLVPSLLLGTTYTYNSHLQRRNKVEVEPFEQNSWHDHTFVEMGLGGNIPFTRAGVTHPDQYVRPGAYAAVGKWFAPLHGLRLWAQVSQTEYNHDPARRFKHSEMGADYLFNFSNAIFGYNPYRKTELTGAAGLNLSARQHVSGLQLGADVSLRGSWYPNQFVGLFIEPRLQGYGHRYMPTSLGNTRVDLIASAMAGLQFNLRGYDHAAGQQAVEDHGGLPARLSLSAGIGTPANNLRTKSYYAPIARVAYESWFTPLSAWRVNAQGSLSRNGGRRLATGTVGLDYLTDLTAQTYGYDPDRALSINALAGMNLGVDYGSQKIRFAADAHFGGQMAVRIAPQTRIFVEPQLAYRLGKRFEGERLGRWMPQVSLGIDYAMTRGGKPSEVATSDRRHFVTMSVGTGAYSGNFTSVHPVGHKFTFVSSATYGQWETGVHGWQVGLSNTLAQRPGKGNENITSVRADYALNMRAAVTGEQTDDKLFQLTGLVGASLNFSSRTGRSAQVVPGAQAAVQLGWRVTPGVELFAQPEAVMYTKYIQPGGSSHPVDGEARMMIGTKFRF